MPRKSKDELNINEKVLKNEEINIKSTTRKSSSTTKKTTKTSASKNTDKEVKQPNIPDVSKKSSNKKTSKSQTKNTIKSTNTTSRKSKSSTTNTKKTTTKRKSNRKSNNVSTEVEYYDLPYRYNETIVKILAQTPTMLFIYWDISDLDRNSYIQKYGENFFYETKPVLVITNKTMNYSFEVEINDFANSWYLHVNDADCDYKVELGRRPIIFNSNIDNYVYITTSNDMEMPNNRILFDKLGKTVFFKNVKNNFIEEKEISSISFIKNIGKIYDIYDLYLEMYKNEIDIEDLTSNNIKLNLSSSNSSTFK